jgi:hypothetical protein
VEEFMDVRMNWVRLIFVIVALLGAVIISYALATICHFGDSMGDLNEILFPKEKVVLAKPVSQQVETVLIKLDGLQFHNFLIFSGIGAGVSCLGFTGLIMERKRREIAARNQKPE